MGLTHLYLFISSHLLSVVGGGGELVEFEPVRHPAAAHVPAGGGGWARLVHAGVCLLPLLRR